ncbi:solute carrier family 23 protein [Desulfoluna sp.]|uniref:uracil-xanthine permease family protein n=1 Tax=Desulfoluna sp. TaxID=2045199 RepID=UPI00263184A4|nr:solute carrier family 23 protein [Desulfoluna sp.]
MEQRKLTYGLDEWPPLAQTLIYGLQWLAITIATVIIIGKVVAGLHFTDVGRQLVYMQKLFFVMGASLFFQVLWGHRLPLITGPATVLLVAILAGSGRDINAIYSCIAAGGAFQLLLNATGLFSRISRYFTSRVVATILMLIALTITPTILNLILRGASAQIGLINLAFAFLFFMVMIVADRLLPGIWKSTMIVWAIIAGSICYVLLVPTEVCSDRGSFGYVSTFFTDFTTTFIWDPGLLISFLICFVALSINDLGSIQAVGHLINPPDMKRRVTAGISFSGLSNMLAGFFGVIGPVNFSMSVGIIASNGNASRFTLIPTSLGMLTLAFLPGVVAFAWNVPSVVVGTILLYIMCSQLAAGMMVAFGTEGFSFEDGLIIGIPIMVSILVSFLPVSIKAAFPPLLTPLIGNGFAMGVLVVMFLEHIVYPRNNAGPIPQPSDVAPLSAEDTSQKSA